MFRIDKLFILRMHFTVHAVYGFYRAFTIEVELDRVSSQSTWMHDKYHTQHVQ